MVASVRFVVDDVAIVDGEATLAGLPDSSAPFVHQFTDVVIGVDGDWAIAHVRAYVFSGR
jgi:hypothetical protein